MNQVDTNTFPAPAVELYRLPNGLRLLVSPRPGDPVAAVTIWVRVGYLDEADPDIGLSHLLEHMFFSGSENFPGAERMATEIKELGGQLNAGTYYDSTHYWVVLPAHNINKALEIQADAMLRPRFDPEVLKTEIGAVIQEGRRKRDNAAAFALEKTYEAGFRRHRIRRWRIGGEDHLRAFGRDDLLRFLGRYYVPGRIVISVAGGVDPDEIRRRVEELFGGMEAGQGPDDRGPTEPPPDRFHQVRMGGDIHRAHLVLLHHGPAVLHPDDYPLRTLAALLGSGRNSRLFRSVRERRRLVSSIGADSEALLDIGMFTVMAECDTDSVAAAQRAILEEIDRARDGFAPEEFERARATLESRLYGTQADALGLSVTLARFEALGGHGLLEKYFKTLFAVDSDQVRAVAERYLDPDHATWLEYLPESASTAAVSDPRAGWKPIDPVASMAPPAAGPAIRFERRPAPPAAPVVETGDTGAGIRLILQPNRTLPVVSATLLIPGGATVEAADRAGLTHLTQAVMLKGSTRWPGERLAEAMENFGGSLGREIADDFFGFSVRSLSRRFPEALGILFDMVLRPELDRKEVDKEKKYLLAAIRRRRDDSMSQAFLLFRQVAFAGTRYALPILGTPRSVGRLDAGAVTDWRRQMVQARGAVLAIAGDFDPDRLRRCWEEYDADWGGAVSAGAAVRAGRPSPAGPKTRSVRRHRTQTAQIVGFPAPPLGHPDEYPLQILQAFTSGLGGRFFSEIRSRRGLAYTVSSMLYRAAGAGAFLVYMATSPESEREARRVLFKEIDNLRRSGPREEEVRRSIRFLQGAHLVGLQTNGARAGAWAEAEVTGFGYREVEAFPEKIGAVTRRQVHEVIEKYLDPKKRLMGIVRGKTD